MVTRPVTSFEMRSVLERGAELAAARVAPSRGLAWCEVNTRTCGLRPSIHVGWIGDRTRRLLVLQRALSPRRYGLIVSFLITGGVVGLLMLPSAPIDVGVPAIASTTSIPLVTRAKIT